MDIITGLQGFVKELNSLDDGTKKMIIKGALVVAAIGPILIGIGSLVGAIGTIVSAGGALVAGIGTFSTFITASAIPAISGLAASATAAIPGIVAFMAPFLPFIAIGAAVVAAGVLIYKNWDKIKETAQQVGAVVSEKWNEVKTKTAEAWGNAKQKVAEAWSNIKAKATEGAANVKAKVMDSWNNVKSKTSEAWNTAKTTVTNATNAMLTNSKQRLDNIKNAFQQNGGGIKGIVAAMWTAVVDSYKTRFNMLNTLTGGKLKELASKFTDMAKNAIDWGKNLINNFLQGIKDAWAKGKSIISDIASAANPFKNAGGGDSATKGSAFIPSRESTATDITVGYNGLAASAAESSNVASAVLTAIDPNAIYEAVKDGASDATITIDIDGRDLRRNLGALGVQFA